MIDVYRLMENMSKFPRPIFIKPCPFCGSKDIKEGTHSGGHGQGSSTVKCRGCGAEVGESWTKGYKSALDVWNNRV